jgi:2,3-bisphosphoglycerate-dependent phosphoglycerate mutase
MIAMSVNKSSKTPVVIHTEGKMADWTTIYSDEMNKNIIPVYRDWHLNERYYGKLQGQNKSETAAIYGKEQVHIWRRSYDIAPPAGECLKDTAERTIPFYTENILAQLQAGKNVLVSAHGNSLRSIVMHIDGLSEDEVLKLEIPTGVPLFFEYLDGTVKRQK